MQRPGTPLELTEKAETRKVGLLQGSWDAAEGGVPAGSSLGFINTEQASAASHATRETPLFVVRARFVGRGAHPGVFFTSEAATLTRADGDLGGCWSW